LVQLKKVITINANANPNLHLSVSSFFTNNIF
jgi:hypothetical protein